MLNYQRAKENRARRDFLRERCYLWGIILRGLGERLNGIQEVSGSIPLISTKIPRTLFSEFYFVTITSSLFTFPPQTLGHFLFKKY